MFYRAPVADGALCVAAQNYDQTHLAVAVCAAEQTANVKLFIVITSPAVFLPPPFLRQRTDGGVGELKYIERSYSPESAEESKMHIGGGVGLVVLIIVLVMFLR